MGRSRNRRGARIPSAPARNRVFPSVPVHVVDRGGRVGGRTPTLPYEVTAAEDKPHLNNTFPRARARNRRWITRGAVASRLPVTTTASRGTSYSLQLKQRGELCRSSSSAQVSLQPSCCSCCRR